MSYLRKQKKQEKRFKKLIPLGITLIILCLLSLGIFFIYQEFFAKKPPESFIPYDPISFTTINLKQKPDQNEIIKKLGKRLGDENLLEDAIKSIIFPDINEDELNLPEEEKIKSWIGEKISLSSFKVSSTQTASAFILELKNPQLTKNFLNKFETNLQKRGNVAETENFRNNIVTSIKGNTEISFSIVSDYLLISQKPDGVKKMIDTRDGRFDSLREARNYYLTKRKIKAKKSLAFGYFDTLEFIKIIYNLATKNSDPDIISKLETLKKRDYLGISIVPEENGARIIGFTKKDNSNAKSNEKTKISLDKMIADDIVTSFEGKNLKPFLENIIFGEENLKDNTAGKKELIKRSMQLETGLDVDRDFLSFFEGQYIFALFSSSEKIDAGLIIDIKNKPEVKEKIGKTENTIVDLLNKYIFKDNKVNFTDHSYNNIKYRYLNLPDNFNIDANYAIVSNYLILATSEKALQKIIDGINGTIDKNLSKNISYQTSFNKFKRKEPHQLIFIDIQNLLKFANKYIKFDYEKLDSKAKQLNTLEIIHEEKEDGNFFDSFLEIK